jgi:hypothetical protein
MSGKFFRLLIAGVFMLTLCTLANAQKAAKPLQKSGKQIESTETRKPSPAAKVINLSGQIAVIVVGQTAKVAWKTTKFTASEMAKPVIKGIFLKATPALTKFGLRLTGKAIKKGYPVVQKLVVTYLRTKVPI